jgi:hypothetical protein
MSIVVTKRELVLHNTVEHQRAQNLTGNNNKQAKLASQVVYVSLYTKPPGMTSLGAEPLGMM